MSSDRAILLAQRRSALRARCAIQRSQLAETTQHIQARLSRIDHGVAALRRYATQPLLITGSLALLTLLGPRRVVRWFGRSAVLVATGRRVLRLLR